MARKVLIQIRRGLEANIGTLAVGELGFCTDTKKLYIGTEAGNVLLVAAQTVGDMLKSIYDTDNDGIVDQAERADTLDGKHASDFQQLTNGGAYGIFPSTASTMVGNEYNILLYAQKRGYSVTQSGSTTLNLTSLFDGRLSPTYSPDGVDPNNPLVITISGLPNIHTQTGGVFGWTCRYWYPSKYKIEAYDSYQDRGWKTILDRSTVDIPTKELLIPIYPNHSGSLTQFKITIYDSSAGSVGSNGFRRVGISEIFFCHPEAASVNQYLDYLYSKTDHTHTKSQITDMPTKLSEFENDIGAVTIVTSPTEPVNLKTGDWWFKEITQ